MLRLARGLRETCCGLAVVACLLCGGAARGALLAYEPFEYGDVAVPAEGQYALGNEDAGVQVLGGQDPTMTPPGFYTGPWVQGGGDSQVVKALPSLSHPNLAAGVGGIQQETIQFSCCSFGRTGRPITPLGVSNGPSKIYESFLIDFGTQGTDAPADFGVRSHELWDGGVGDAFRSVALFLNSFSGTDLLSLEVTTASGTTIVQVAPGSGLTLPVLAASNAGTHLVVMRYDFDPVSRDRVRVYLDPVGPLEPGVADADVSVVTSDLFITHQGAFTGYTFSGSGHVPGAIDEIRWASSYADATPLPEPGQGLGLLLGGGLSGWLARRRKRATGR